MAPYYVDTCIWLNIIKKEEKEYESSKKFLDALMTLKCTVLYSGAILRELEIKLPKQEFQKVKNQLNNGSSFREVESSVEDRNKARRIESQYNFSISFYDLLHMVLARKENAILVTRDEFLLDVAKVYKIQTMKPEDFLSTI
ncbi:MAG: PIN domain-containing protein [bacterium]|nr:PIN domain-containing protein [bacterium]